LLLIASVGKIGTGTANTFHDVWKIILRTVVSVLGS
jgi:hypothetical protein